MVGAGGDRGARLGEGPRAPPHEHRGADDTPGLLGGQVVVPDVDPVGPCEQGQVGPVVHDDEGASAAERHDLPRRREHLSGRGRLHPHLDDAGSPLHREPGLPDRVLVADDGVEAAQPGDPGRMQVGEFLHGGALCTSLDAPASRAYFPPPRHAAREGSMPDTLDNKIIDKRVARRYVRKGLLDEKDYERYLKSLPDVADQAVPVESEVEHVETGEDD